MIMGENLTMTEQINDGSSDLTSALTAPDIYIKWRKGNLPVGKALELTGWTKECWEAYTDFADKWLDKDNVCQEICNYLDASRRSELKTYVPYILLEYRKYELARTVLLHGGSGIILQAERLHRTFATAG